MRVSKTDDAGVFELKSLLNFANAEDLLDGGYEITDCGKIVATGSFDFKLKPMETYTITIPGATAVTGTSVISSLFSPQRLTLCGCEKGYEVCFDQICLNELNEKTQPSMAETSLSATSRFLSGLMPETSATHSTSATQSLHQSQRTAQSFLTDLFPTTSSAPRTDN